MIVKNNYFYFYLGVIIFSFLWRFKIIQLNQVRFTGLARVGMKIPQDGNRANRYGHVAVVHEHIWRTLCSVCATSAIVAQPVPCNS